MITSRCIVVDHAGVRPPVLALRVLVSPKFFSLSPADHKGFRIKFVLSVPFNFLALPALNEFVGGACSLHAHRRTPASRPIIRHLFIHCRIHAISPDSRLLKG